MCSIQYLEKACSVEECIKLLCALYVMRHRTGPQGLGSSLLKQAKRPSIVVPSYVA